MSVFLRKAKTENGWVVGIPSADPRITSFKGVPYAKPPVGDLRWRAPQPAEDWEGELECKEFKPISMQTPPGLDPDNIYSREWNFDPEIEMSEDCLYLNIWTPAKTGDEKLPVFVWDFGGGLKEGNTAEVEFDGERMARRGIVVVTVNYRVNSFGFLCHPEITAENPETPGNFGHLDQQFGIKWVKRNIAAFGGDPDCITIGGQSAGGRSTLVQMTSPSNEGLFQRAIVMSGNYASVFGDASGTDAFTLEEAEQEGIRFFEHLGVKTLAEARAIDAITLRDKTTEYNHRFGMVCDGHFQPMRYREALYSGKRLQVPMMTGWTADESTDRPSATTPDELRAEILAKVGEEYGQKVIDLLDIDNDFDGAIEKLTHRMPQLGPILSAKAEERLLGDKASKRYLYKFGPEVPGWDNPGAFHSFDLWFWFESLLRCWRPLTGKHFDLSRLMCNYITNFIKTGDPNGPDADGQRMPEWKPYTDACPQVMGLMDKVGLLEEAVSDVTAAVTEGGFQMQYKK